MKQDLERCLQSTEKKLGLLRLLWFKYQDGRDISGGERKVENAKPKFFSGPVGPVENCHFSLV